MLFRNRIGQSEIAERHGLSLQRVRELAMGKGFPPCELTIGRSKFYDLGAVDLYFKTRVDRRAFNGRERGTTFKRRRRRSN